MNWDDLRYVLAVARTGSLGDAARALGVAHSTVYRRLTAFESEHGVRVFERLPNGYALTPGGRDLVQVAEAVELRVSEAERRLIGRDAELKGEVRITAPDALGDKLCAALPAFVAEHPEVTVSLAVTAETADLARREADIAVRAMARPPESLVGKKLADVAFAVYGLRDVVLDGEPKDWVVFEDSLSHTPQAKWERMHVSPERVRVKLGNRSLFMAAVRSGIGVGVLPCGMADQEPTLCRIGGTISELSVPLWLLTHPDLRDVPRVRALMDFLATRLGAEKDLLAGQLMSAAVAS